MWRLPSIQLRWFAAGISLLFQLAAPLPSRAESSVVFTPIEESKYLLNGEGFQEITRITLTIDYDTTYLASPHVNVMGGRLQDEDGVAATSPGKLLLQIENEERNAVFEVCVYFQKRGDFPAVINFVTAEVTDLAGSVRPIPVKMVAPVNVPQSEEISAATTPEAPPAVSSPGGGADSSVEENSNAADGIVPVDPPVKASAAAVSHLPQSEVRQAATADTWLKAVFERFREFTGNKGLDAFTALFAGADPCCRQIPPVLIADGKRTARITISGVENGDEAPHFTASNGRIISLEHGTNEEEWIAVVRPDKNVFDVRMGCAAANGTFDFPLIVAPAINVPRSELSGLSEKTFMTRLRKFLAGKPTRGKPKPPLWFQEYLFTANYLATREER